MTSTGRETVPEGGRSALAEARGRAVLASSGEGLIALMGGLAVIAFCLGMFYLATATDADTWVPILVFFVLLFISLPICHRLAGRPTDRKLRKILIVALILKLFMVGPRYFLNEVVYEGEGDASRYHQAGGYFVQNMFEGEFSISGAELTIFPRTTQSVGYMTGMLYVVFGTSLLGGYLVFSWVAWLGYLFFFRAFRVAFPNAPPYRAAYLLFFMPSLLFWPSSPGKEAVMVFLIGLMTLGSARMLSGRGMVRGITYATLAGVGMINLRPHLLLISAFALVCSLLARSGGKDTRRTMFARILVLLFLLPVIVSGIGRMDSMLGTSAGGTSSIDQSLDETLTATGIGGSAFAATPVRAPWDLPAATLTVLFRPFVFEAGNAPNAIAAVEGTLLLLATLACARWIWEIFPAMYRYNFAAYCGGFVLAFVVAFSNIANAGILARQRTQMFPLLMLLVAIAYEHHQVRLQAKAAALEAMARGERPEVGLSSDLAADAPSPPVPAGSAL